MTEQFDKESKESFDFRFLIEFGTKEVKIQSYFWVYFPQFTQTGVFGYKCLLLVHCWEELNAMTYEHLQRKKEKNFPWE